MKRTDTQELIPYGADRCLLHTCCAPCSSAILEWLLDHDIRPIIYFCNPNIYPREEYIKRRDELARHARSLGLEVVEDEPDHQQWLSAIQGLEDEPERGSRCQRCFEYRLLQAARYAHEHDISVFTTTLASSRWKRLDQIEAAGLKAEAAYPGTHFWARNWRKAGLQERRNELLRLHGFYNQQYCGCEFSMHRK